MTQTNRFFDATTDADVADEIGALRAEIDQLRKAEAFLVDLLKHKGVEAVDGKHYRVAISYGVETKRTDWHAVAERLGPSRQLVQAHTRVTTADRVRVSALKRS